MLAIHFNTKYWLKISLINLLIVAGLGVLLRYKIGFEFLYFDQKNIHHAHSHFAFIGWITHTIYVLLTNFIQHRVSDFDSNKSNKIILLNLLCAYGLLISYFIQGYGIFSGIFTLINFFAACLFAHNFFKCLKKIDPESPGRLWFKAALWFNIFSSMGTFYLIYMMLSRNFDDRWYLLSGYFYLHFQYNGFFIFSCIGLALNEAYKILPKYAYDKRIFLLFLAAVIPTYFLSVLWVKLPVLLYIVIVIAAFIQVLAWVKIIRDIRKSALSKNNLTRYMAFLFLYVAIAFTIKLLLQLGSTIPFISTLAFGFRPIVIAYLHLVLLAVVSAFLLSFIYTFKLILNNTLSKLALTMFLMGIFLNEVVLAVQGVASFSYIAVAYANETLLGIALILFLGALLMVISQSKSGKQTPDS